MATDVVVVVVVVTVTEDTGNKEKDPNKGNIKGGARSTTAEKNSISSELAASVSVMKKQTCTD